MGADQNFRDNPLEAPLHSLWSGLLKRRPRFTPLPPEGGAPSNSPPDSLRRANPLMEMLSSISTAGGRKVPIRLSSLPGSFSAPPAIRMIEYTVCGTIGEFCHVP